MYVMYVSMLQIGVTVSDIAEIQASAALEQIIMKVCCIFLIFKYNNLCTMQRTHEYNIMCPKQMKKISYNNRVR